jgi:hypothetical protein
MGKDVFGSIGARSVPVDQVAGGRLQRAARGAIMRTFPAGGLKDRRNAAILKVGVTAQVALGRQPGRSA